MRLCQFKDALGIPNQGFHQKRLFGLAMNDLIGTVVIGLVLAHFTKGKTRGTYIKAIALVFFLGIALHWLFCVDTAMMKFLFGTLTQQ
jgi:hypothetical protein